MSRPYTPLALANAFVLKSKETTGRGIDAMSLQKLVYFASGWWMGFREDALCSDLPEMWRYGPIFASLYSSLKVHRLDAIQIPQSPGFLKAAPVVDEDDRLGQQIIAWIWARYGGLSHLQLSTLAHEAGSPWEEMARSCNYNVSPHTVIPETLLRAHFRSQAALLDPALDLPHRATING